MQSALFYLLGFGAFAMVAGAVIAVYAMRNAPEGYEDENGFVGMTKGDEILLKQYEHEPHYSTVHSRMDVAA